MAEWAWFDRKGRDTKVTVGSETFDVDSEGKLSPVPSPETEERLRAHPRYLSRPLAGAPSLPPAPSSSPDGPPQKPLAAAESLPPKKPVKKASKSKSKKRRPSKGSKKE